MMRVHVRGGTALLAGDPGRRGCRDRPPGRRPPRRERPGLPRAAQRDRCRRARLAAGNAGAAHRVHGGRGERVAHGLPRASSQVRAARDQRVQRGGRRRRTCRRDRVPTLDEVSERLEPLTGFRYVPAPGLVPLREFYGSLADRVFHSTQYIRHPEVPLYTPEPDIIHEVIGHGHLIATPTFSELHRLAGVAMNRLERDESHTFLSKVFWFSLEFGIVHEDGELRAYGAGILSSYGRDRRVPRHGAPPARPRRDGHGRLRHHPLPARPLPWPSRSTRWSRWSAASSRPARMNRSRR